ncbi:MAG: hypothetical protein KDC07_05215 [Chitinophagaceae bacterium]|nr:hypothetical protein [Chitinophagaceae bacterium]
MRIQKHVLNSFLLALGYGIVFHFIQYFFYRIQITHDFARYDSLMRWDALSYHSVAELGYIHTEGEGTNTAFWPLFPIIWRITGLGAMSISLLNIIFFSIGFAAFNTVYKIDAPTRLLWLTIPLFYLAWIPGADALFIMFTSLVLAGIHNRNHWLVRLAMLGVALTKPAVLILLPALLLMELLTSGKKHIFSALKVFLADHLIPALLGLLLFTVYQYRSVGIWFDFIRQRKLYGYYFRWPTFPLNSRFGPGELWLDAAALFLCFIALVWIVRIVVAGFRKHAVAADRLFILSCCYLVGAMLFILFFNPTWEVNTTNVTGAYQLALATPFFWVLLYRFTYTGNYKVSDYFKVLLLTNIFWLLFEHYQHIRYVLYFNFASVLIIMYMLQANKRIQWMQTAIVVVNFILQVYMIQRYMMNIKTG